MSKILFFAFSVFAIISAENECLKKNYPDGLVCVCDTLNCDTLEFSLPTLGTALVVSTNQNGLRFKKRLYPARNERLNNNNNSRIEVDSTKKFQEIIGFGGALTGSVSHLLHLLQPELKTKIYHAYFNKNTGIGLDFLRLPIGGCDFDLEPWAYNETPENDELLTNFTSLDQRDALKVSIIKEIERDANVSLKLLGTAWSPPKWMKTNNDWSGISVLRSEYYDTWAKYHVKYLELMKEQNITFWGVTTGNEPMNGLAWWMFCRFMSLGWIPKAQGNWVGSFFGPQLKAFQNDIVILAGDDQRFVFPWWVKEMQKGHPKALEYTDGFAVHWYMDGMVPPEITLDQVAKRYPRKLILNTESSIGDKPLQHHGPIFGSWIRALLYIEAIFNDLLHSVNGWIDWNLILDEKGGPNYVKNYVDAPIIVDSSGHEAYKQPIFYVLGHFSRFIIAKSVRISAQSSDPRINVLAFLRPDGYKTLIIHNKSKVTINVDIIESSKRYNIILPPESLNTVLYQAE